MPVAEHLREDVLVLADARAPLVSCLCGGSRDIDVTSRSTCRVVSCSDPRESLVDWSGGVPLRERVRSSAGYTGSFQDGIDAGLVNPEGRRDFSSRHPSGVQGNDLALASGRGSSAGVRADVRAEPSRRVRSGNELDLADLALGGLPHGFLLARIQSIEIAPYDGWVYDASTTSGAFYASTIVARNCGLDGHDSSPLANGLIMTVEDAANNPISHPRCQRSWSPRPDLTTPEQAASATPTTTATQRADAAQVEQARLAETQARAVRQSASRRRQAKIDARTSRLSG